MSLILGLEMAVILIVLHMSNTVSFKHKRLITIYNYVIPSSSSSLSSLSLSIPKCRKSNRFVMYAIDNDGSQDSSKNHNDDNNNEIDDDDDDDDIMTNVTSFRIRQNELRKSNADAAYDDHDSSILGVRNNTQYFREYVKEGLEKFKKNDLDGCVLDLQRARTCDSKQPLMQLGIFLYINEDYSNASKELMQDIMTIENAKINKASELRIWRSASLLKLGNSNDAMQILNTPVTKNLTNMNEDRFIMNITIALFNGDIKLEQMIQVIEDSETNDVSSFRFYGNFYTALYLDAIGETDLCKTFLSFAIAMNPSSSSRDIWYHLPRVFYSKRFGQDDGFLN